MDVTEAIVRVAHYETHKEQIRSTLMNYIAQHGTPAETKRMGFLRDIQLARRAVKIRDRIAEQQNQEATKAIDAFLVESGGPG